MQFSFLKVLEEGNVNKLMRGEKGKYFSKFRNFLRGGVDYVKWVVILEFILLNPVFTKGRVISILSGFLYSSIICVEFRLLKGIACMEIKTDIIFF